MGKSILIVNESLNYGGGEKSLLNLLSAIDYQRFDVDLQLMRYGADWEKYIPVEVNVLPSIPYMDFTRLPIAKAVIYSLRHIKFKWLWSRFKYTILLRLKPDYGNIQKACLFWKCQGDCFQPVNKSYDYVIAYAQGVPTFYVADKTCPKQKKLSWINVSYKPRGQVDYIEEKYKSIDKIVAVSESVKDIEESVFPSFSGRMDIMRDMVNPELIYRLAVEPIGLSKDLQKLTIITLGRLNHQKGYDIAVEAATELKKSGIPFVWYVLGDGAMEQEIQTWIIKRGLQQEFILLGAKTNPYPFLKLADVYVQTSKFEGFGLAIAEARILNIPVVTTKFDAVFMQMVDGKNGLVTEMNGLAVAKAIIELWTDKGKYNSIVNYLKNEPKGNMELIHEFYKLLY